MKMKIFVKGHDESYTAEVKGELKNVLEYLDECQKAGGYIFEGESVTLVIPEQNISHFEIYQVE